MCNRSTFCCIVVGVVAFVVFYEPGCELLANYGILSGDSGGSDASACNPSPGSWSSCCTRNNVITAQIRAMMKGSSEACLPNIGSKFLGATIASTRDTQPYRHPQSTPASEKTNKPQLVIKPGALTIGKNWHFTGGAGALVIKLYQPSLISGFTVIHPAACQIPPGYEKSAPKDFYVMGMNELEEGQPFHFGNFTYALGGASAQTFPVEACSTDRFQFIEFRFLSNHGNPNYTSLYKLQIHGDVGPPPAPTPSSS